MRQGASTRPNNEYSDHQSLPTINSYVFDKMKQNGTCQLKHHFLPYYDTYINIYLLSFIFNLISIKNNNNSILYIYILNKDSR